MINLPFSAISVNRACASIFLVCALSLSSPTHADDWPIFRGPNSDGISKETGIKTSGELAVSWRRNVGLGYSSPVVANGIVVVSGHDGEKSDSLFCFDEKEGTEKWRFTYPQDIGALYFQGGTTGAATIEGDRIYHGAREGELFCLDAADGKVIWQIHLVKDLEFTKPMWGFTGAPLVQGDRLYITAGESGVALNKKDGSVIWKSKNEEAGYSTPQSIRSGDKDYLIFSNKRAYVCVDLENGEQKWSVKWMTRHGVNAANPVISGEYIFISSGYGKGATLVKWTGSGDPEAIWKSRDMKNQMNASVLVDGILYGVDGNESTDGTALKAMELISGETKWAETAIGHGTMSVADGKLIVLTETGELQIAPVSSTGYQPTLKQQAVKGRVWTVPVVANGHVFCRGESGDFASIALK